MTRSVLLASTACLSLFVGAPVMAQQAPSEEVAEVVVTGSRIARRDFVAESPIVTLTVEAVSASGKQTLGEALNQMPQLSANSASTTGSRENAGQTNPDLRGLGSRRTLVLLDGRRLQPSDAFGAIDLNTVPNAILSTIEIITGGASAIYGSDALAGVINLKTRGDFSGLEIDAQAGTTSRGDGEDFSISATGGVNFANGRGNAILSASYLDRREVFPRSSRPWFREFATISNAPTNKFVLTGVPQSAINTLFNSYGITQQSSIPTPADFVSINPDGTLFVFQATNSAAGGTNYKPGMGQPDLRWLDGQPQIVTTDKLQLSSPIIRYATFGRVTYQVSENVRAFLQGNYTAYDTQVGGGGALITTAAPQVPATTFFLQRTDLARLLNARATNSAVTTNIANFPVPDPTEIQYDIYQVQAGLSGRITSLGWSWDAYVAHGETKQDLTDRNKLDRTAFTALTTAPDGGQSICAGGLNLYPALAISGPCAEFLLRDAENHQDLKQTLAEANLQGGLFDLPAGDLRFAAGLAYRKNSFAYDPDPRLAPIGTGTATQVFGYGVFNARPTSGITRVTEGYAEFLVPLLSDLPFVRRLEADLAYRYSDYKGVGGVHTYKATGEWEVASGFLLRGGYQRAIRAPTVGELFSPEQLAVGNIGNIALGGGDPCSSASIFRQAGAVNAAQLRTLCLATGVPLDRITTPLSTANQTVIILSGNPNLEEEAGDSYTIGAVFQPRFKDPMFSRMSLSIDYYRIVIDDAIGNLQARGVLDTCYNLNGLNPTYSPTNSSCQLIRRAGADQPTRRGALDGTRTATINLARYETSGVDVQLDWSIPVGEWVRPDDRVHLSFIVAYQDTYKIRDSEASPLREFAGTIGNAAISGLAHPEWKALATAAYQTGPTEFGLRLRYIGEMSNSANVGTAATQPGTKEVTYTDLFARYDMSRDIELRAGATNLFDKGPPVWIGGNVTDPATYDVIGRSFYVGLKARF